MHIFWLMTWQPTQKCTYVVFPPPNLRLPAFTQSGESLAAEQTSLWYIQRTANSLGLRLFYCYTEVGWTPKLRNHSPIYQGINLAYNIFCLPFSSNREDGLTSLSYFMYIQIFKNYFHLPFFNCSAQVSIFFQIAKYSNV